jgi:hypothetical protein
LELTTGKKPKSWRFFEQHFQRGTVALYALKNIYKTWKDIDLYLGGLLEKVSKDSFGKKKQVSAALMSGSSHIGSVLIGPQDLHFFNCDGCQTFIIYEIHCYLSPPKS